MLRRDGRLRGFGPTRTAHGDCAGLGPIVVLILILRLKVQILGLELDCVLRFIFARLLLLDPHPGQSIRHGALGRPGCRGGGRSGL
jgi:hypothetical protein